MRLKWLEAPQRHRSPPPHVWGPNSAQSLTFSIHHVKRPSFIQSSDFLSLMIRTYEVPRLPVSESRLAISTRIRGMTSRTHFQSHRCCMYTVNIKVERARSSESLRSALSSRGSSQLHSPLASIRIYIALDTSYGPLEMFRDPPTSGPAL